MLLGIRYGVFSLLKALRIQWAKSPPAVVVNVSFSPLQATTMMKRTEESLDSSRRSCRKPSRYHSTTTTTTGGSSVSSSESHSHSHSHSQSHSQSQNGSEVFRSTDSLGGGAGGAGLSSSLRTHQPKSASAVSSASTGQVWQELNHLKFASMKLYGRDEELRVLHSAWEDTNASSNLLLVSGTAGTGKTALLQEFGARLTRNNNSNVLFAQGQYHPHVTLPYEAFSSIFSQLCSDIRSHPLYQSQIQQAVLQAVGEDYKLLLDLIPNLGELIFDAKAKKANETQQQQQQQQEQPQEAPTSQRSLTRTHSSTHRLAFPDALHSQSHMVKSKEKFKFLLQRFLHALIATGNDNGNDNGNGNGNNNHYYSAVVALDNVQWMDPASLQLLEWLIQDSKLQTSLLIVALYRTEDTDPSDDLPPCPPVLAPLVRRLANTGGAEGPRGPPALVLHNLSLPIMQQYIADLFNLGLDQDVLDLATIVYKRVDGNIFFAMQFLTALRDAGQLYYSIAHMKWTWKLTEIQASTVVASNVLAVLMNQMDHLPPETKALLQVVACLGPSFPDKLVEMIWTNLQELPHVEMVLPHEILTLKRPKELLADLEARGLIEQLSDNTATNTKTTSHIYCFSHSQIGLAVHEMLDPSTMPRIKYQIGRVLFENKAYLEYHNLLFVMVDLWNAGAEHVHGSKQNRILIELNLEAGQKALESSAFGASVQYLHHAVDRIPKAKRWTTEYYDLTLSIYNCLIKAEYSNGTMGPVREHASEIIAQKDRPFLDKIDAYTALIIVLSTHERNHSEAIALALVVVSQLGTNFWLQGGKLSVVGSLVKTKKLLSKTPLDTLLNKDEMQDQPKLIALDILSTVSSSMYASNPDLLMCSVLKTLRWSLKYGICKDTAKCVSFYGLVEMALGNAELGTKACKLAVKLAERHDLMTTEYSPTSAVYGFVLPWTTPLHSCANQLVAGYNCGLETGDLHYGFMNIVLFCFFCYCMGKPCKALEADMREYAKQMREYDQSLQLQFLSLTWQLILNLMGQCDGNPAVLKGEEMDYEAMLKAADDDKNPPLRGQTQCHRLQLAVYYRDFDLAAKLIVPASSISMVNPANLIIWRSALFEGVAAFELVRRGKKKWKKTALQALAKTQKWVDKGNVNCVHILYLLQAEKAAMEGSVEQARRLFDLAIVTSARNGFRNDRALATERCADMYLYVAHDDFWFHDYFEKACEAYREFEAFGKVEHMIREPRLKESIRHVSEISIVSDSVGPKQRHRPTAPQGGGTHAISDLTGIRFTM